MLVAPVRPGAPEAARRRAPELALATEARHVDDPGSELVGDCVAWALRGPVRSGRLFHARYDARRAGDTLRRLCTGRRGVRDHRGVSGGDSRAALALAAG